MQGNTEQLRKSKPNFQTETIKGLVILFYKNLLLPSARQFTTAHALCKTMAKRFGEKDKLEELERLFKRTDIGYPLALIQTVVFRDIMLGSTPNKTYNYGLHLKPVNLGDMILALENAMSRILDIFTEICVDHDIDTTFVTPIIEGLDLGKPGGL